MRYICFGLYIGIILPYSLVLTSKRTSLRKALCVCVCLCVSPTRMRLNLVKNVLSWIFALPFQQCRALHVHDLQVKKRLGKLSHHGIAI